MLFVYFVDVIVSSNGGRRLRFWLSHSNRNENVHAYAKHVCMAQHDNMTHTNTLAEYYEKKKKT